MADLIDDPELEALGQLAEEFLMRWRLGDQPSVADYAEQHPELADGIRALFPTLILMERSKPNRSSWTADDTRDDSLSHNLLPRRLGEYELVRELGRGGMGIVFEAKQEALDRYVAVKVLPGTAAYDDRTRQRFLREARIIARLRHPHIIPIHTVGEQDGVLFYVMDLIRGTSLDQLKPPDRVEGDGHARARWVARLGVQAAETLTYAHGEGILHRDVKPANFVLDQDGKLWLTDFGLAKLMGDPSLTATGDCLGTLRYLAPEGLRGESSVRSDVYGLGLTLYELLVGVPAFPETDRTRLLQLIAETNPIPPRHYDPTIPRDLETIILKASARDPADRYEAPTELAADLRRFLAAQAIRAHRTGLGVRLVRWVRHNPVFALVVATTILLALLLIAFVGNTLLTSSQTARRLESPAQSPPASVGPGQTEARQSTPSGRPNGPPWGFGRRHMPAVQEPAPASVPGVQGAEWARHESPRPGAVDSPPPHVPGRAAAAFLTLGNRSGMRAHRSARPSWWYFRRRLIMRGEYIFELCLFVVLCFVVFMNWWDQRKQEKQSSHLLSDSSRLTESGPRGPRRGVTPQGGAGVVRRGRFSALLSPGQPPLRFPLLEIPRG